MNISSDGFEAIVIVPAILIHIAMVIASMGWLIKVKSNNATVRQAGVVFILVNLLALWPLFEIGWLLAFALVIAHPLVFCLLSRIGFENYSESLRKNIRIARKVVVGVSLVLLLWLGVFFIGDM